MYLMLKNNIDGYRSRSDSGHEQKYQNSDGT